jgi:hypothetical protein
MARVKRSNSPNPASGDTPQSRRVPVILSCPVCHVLLGDVPTEVHLQGHHVHRTHRLETRLG